MTPDSLAGEHWLIAYEAANRGWLQSNTATDHIAADPSFSWMRAQGVSFYTRFKKLTPKVVASLRRKRHGAYGEEELDDDLDDDLFEDDTDNL